MIKKHTILTLLEKCRTMKELKQLHGLMITTALIDDVVPLSKLIDFCANPENGDLAYAHSLFLHVDRPSAYMWNSIIRGLAGADHPDAALSVYRSMQRSGSSPDHFTFPFALKAIAGVPDLITGKCVHGRVIKTGYESDVYTSTNLIHMYASCGAVATARSLFDTAANTNVVGWTAMIAGYVDGDRLNEAIRLFRAMEFAGVAPNEITIVHVLVACARSRDLETGRWIHSRIQRMGTNPIKSNVVLATALLDMYARCGSLQTARQLFDEMPKRNQVSWNTMISACDQYGRCDEVLQLFSGMRKAGVEPDKVTLLGLLGACASKGALSFGQGIHGFIEKTSGDDVAISTSLMEMYSKSGDSESAMRVFGGLETRDVLAWTTMIIGFSTNGRVVEALNLYTEMRGGGVEPDHVTFIGVLNACGRAGMVEEGRKCFDSMRSVYGIAPTVEHYGCMVDMLSRAGHVAEAERLVRSMPIKPSIAVWGALLSGCEIHGEIGVAERVGRRLSEFDPQGGGVYVMLSNVYAGAGRWQGVGRARQLMWDKGVKKTHGTSTIEVNIPLP